MVCRTGRLKHSHSPVPLLFLQWESIQLDGFYELSFLQFDLNLAVSHSLHSLLYFFTVYWPDRSSRNFFDLPSSMEWFSISTF